LKYGYEDSAKNVVANKTFFGTDVNLLTVPMWMREEIGEQNG